MKISEKQKKQPRLRRVPAALLMSATLSLLSPLTRAEEAKAPPQTPTAAAPTVSDEKVEVDQIKEKYWARGDESELGVVQNRLYSKANRFELGVNGGVLYSDPFLSVNPVGGHLGYHFNETWSLHALAWKNIVHASGAKEKFQQNVGGEVNDNPPSWYAGGEVNASLLYGKLSLVGAKIIYYDLYLIGGAGATKTENGTYPTGHAGIGQRFYISQNFSLRTDYRLMVYKEDIVEKEVLKHKGEVTGQRTNFSNAITVGVDYLFGGSSK